MHATTVSSKYFLTEIGEFDLIQSVCIVNNAADNGPSTAHQPFNSDISDNPAFTYPT